MDDDFRTDEPALPIAQLLPVRAVTITLQFTGASQPKFFHQASLAAFVRHLLREPPEFDTLLRIHCLETGRTHFAPGDHYSFSVISLAGGEQLLDELVQSLQMLPDSALRRERRICFRDNLRFVALRDELTGQPVDSVQALSTLDADGLTAMAAQLAEQNADALQVRFDAPVRLLKDKGKRLNARGESRYCHTAEDLDPALLINRVRDSFADLLRRRGASYLPPRTAAPEVGYGQTDVFWLDGIYSDPGSRDRGMGGLCGQLTLKQTEQLSSDWWQLLALGQFTGIGQRTSQGWGRFRLGPPGADWAERDDTVQSTSPIRQIVGDKNLLTAYYHCLFEQEQLGRAGDLSPALPEDPLPDPVATLREHFAALEGLRYTVPAPQQFTARDQAAVAVPPLIDRVMQQATLQVLLPALVQLQATGRAQLNSPDLAQSFIDSQALHRRLEASDAFGAARKHAATCDARTVAAHLSAVFGEDPIMRYVESWLSADGDNPGVTLGSPLVSLIAQPIGLEPVAVDAWRELANSSGRQGGHHKPSKGVRIRSRSPYRHYNTNGRSKTGT
ncbi:MAG: CRISPR system precrRNA processing endoribonuclease RAMP protein Cas6 [Pseudomonadota bacterium]